MQALSWFFTIKYCKTIFDHTIASLHQHSNLCLVYVHWHQTPKSAFQVKHEHEGVIKICRNPLMEPRMYHYCSYTTATPKCFITQFCMNFTFLCISVSSSDHFVLFTPSYSSWSCLSSLSILPSSAAVLHSVN